MAFTLEERQSLGIHGLLPPRFKTQEEQVKLCKENVERYSDELNKYVYLAGLQVIYDLNFVEIRKHAIPIPHVKLHVGKHYAWNWMFGNQMRREIICTHIFSICFR